MAGRLLRAAALWHEPDALGSLADPPPLSLAHSEENKVYIKLPQLRNEFLLLNIKSAIPEGRMRS